LLSLLDELLLSLLEEPFLSVAFEMKTLLGPGLLLFLQPGISESFLYGACFFGTFGLRTFLRGTSTSSS
jgi:hypothetical protein